MNNERAAIMAITFCIGFTTALTAYGIPVEDIPVAYGPAQSVASVASSQQTAPEAAAPAAPTPTASVYSYVEADDTGLYHVIEGERVLVAPTVATAGDIPEAYTAVHTPVASRDAQYVFFCAETAASNGNCFPRIFSHETFSVRPVLMDDGNDTVSPADLSAAWTSGGRLQINQLVSVSPATPWHLQ